MAALVHIYTAQGLLFHAKLEELKARNIEEMSPIKFHLFGLYLFLKRNWYMLERYDATPYYVSLPYFAGIDSCGALGIDFENGGYDQALVLEGCELPESGKGRCSQMSRFEYGTYDTLYTMEVFTGGRWLGDRAQSDYDDDRRAKDTRA
jgi:hypothetical protein